MSHKCKAEIASESPTLAITEWLRQWSEVSHTGDLGLIPAVIYTSHKCKAEIASESPTLELGTSEISNNKVLDHKECRFENYFRINSTEIDDSEYSKNSHHKTPNVQLVVCIVFYLTK